MRYINFLLKSLTMEDTRLQKFIAHCGVSSRRNAENLILDGRVTVNGQVITQLGTKIDPNVDAVKLDGKRLHSPNSSKMVVYAFNKPRGCVSTLYDPQGRETVAHYIPKSFPRIYPVGRLDYDTEGLLLLTNDGELANLIMHPRYEVWKIYLVKVKGKLSQADISSIRAGFNLRGKMTSPAKIEQIQTQGDKTWYEYQLVEGRNHQIKETLLDFNVDVLKIKRVNVAGVEMGILNKGELRLLNHEELHKLKAQLEKQKTMHARVKNEQDKAIFEHKFNASKSSKPKHDRPQANPAYDRMPNFSED